MPSGVFTVRSAPPDWRWAAVRLAVAASVALCYGVAGFWLLDEREFGINFTLADSIHRTLLYLTWAGDPRLMPRTPYAAWFLDSLYALSAVVIAYAGFAFFRPVIYRYRTLPRERAMAKEIVERHGRSSLDYFKLWPNKSYFFSPSRRCFIAYGVGAQFRLLESARISPSRWPTPSARRKRSPRRSVSSGDFAKIRGGASRSTRRCPTSCPSIEASVSRG